MMNYDKIILELMTRIQSLESDVADLKIQVHNRYEEDMEDDTIDEMEVQDEYTRSEARQRAMEIIEEKFPEYIVSKATRSEGSGIKVFKPDAKKPLFIKFYHSKSFKHNTGKSSNGWHVVRLNHVIGTVIDLCLFSMVDENDNWNYFIYEPEELGMYNDENRSNRRDVLHLYFSVQNGRATEIREEPIDVTDHLNNWDILQ